MKILCLHGTFCNAETFQTQLEPLINILEKPGVVDFEWIDGFHTTPAPPTFQDYYGSPPHYRWFDYGVEKLEDDPVVKFRAIPEGLSAEDTIRTAIGDTRLSHAKHIEPTVDQLFKVLEGDPEIVGLFAYSEGAILASTVILEEQRRQEEEGRPCQIKHATFFAGWPPILKRDGLAAVALADECEDVISVPTCHIIGCNDPYIHGAMALFALSDDDTATLFDHGKGHTVPRDKQTIEELASAIQSTWSKAE